jgi:[lysine-biosynthesis-protein LysW]---L-2-aminoadipate ligase
VVNIGLVYDQLRPDERLIIDAAKSNRIRLDLFDTNQMAFEVTGKQNGLKDTDVLLQRCISYFRSVHATAALESYGKMVVNSHKVATICGNKLLASIRLAQAKIPTPRTFLAFTMESALGALEELGYPAVMKPIVGSWGRLVAQVKDPDTAKSIIESREYMHPVQQLYYLQEKVKRPDRDIRCYVIGDNAVAAIYRHAPPDDWRTNTAKGGVAENCPITPELAEVSIRAAQAMGGGAFGVDLMETESGLVVHEVNHTTEFKNTVRVTKVDIPTLLLNFAIEQIKR